MRLNVVDRIVGAIGIGLIAVLALGVTVNAAQPPGQQRRQDQKDNKDKKQQDDKKRAQVQQQDRDRVVQQQQQRIVQYHQVLSQQQAGAQRRVVDLQRTGRTAQHSVQQQYVAGLAQLQLTIASQRNYDFGRDLRFFSVNTFRYSRGGRYYSTNQYGADMLRQAIDYGYEQGVRAGIADRQDRWASNYQNAYAYQDANYGYGGFYIEQADYNYYFREGFRRGYQDGYGNRFQYGTYVSGRGTLLGAIAATILNFQAIR